MKWTYKNQINNFLTAVSNDSEGEIWIYGDITTDKWTDDDVTPSSIRDALRNMGPVKTLNIRVNSYGGSVYAGNAIINIIDSYRRKNNVYVNAYIEGIAASMGSGIPMVADKIYMAENAMMMVHKPYTIVMGNSADLQKEIEILQKVEDTLVKNYMRHFKGTEEELRDMLANETWLTADEALEYGLCDEVIEAVEIAASAKGVVINGKEFRHDADKIAAKFCPGTPLAKADCGDFDAKQACVHPPDITIANFPSSALKTDKGENKVFEYDAKLGEYGIDEEKFGTFNLEANVVLNILENATLPQQNPIPLGGHIVIPFSQVKDTLGEKMNVDKLLALAKAGMEIDQHMSDKAKAYDKLVNSAIEDALKNGIRAKGENFNETKWKKILSSLDYDEIIDQSKEWDEEAKIALNAGKRVSQPWIPIEEPDNRLVNPDDYSLFK